MTWKHTSFEPKNMFMVQKTSGNQRLHKGNHSHFHIMCLYLSLITRSHPSVCVVTICIVIMFPYNRNSSLPISNRALIKRLNQKLDNIKALHVSTKYILDVNGLVLLYRSQLLILKFKNID